MHAGVEPAPGEWRLHGRTQDEKRYSPLAQINVENVDQLGLAWSFEDFVVRGRTHRGVEATPLMVDGVLYITGPWAVVYALDAATGAHLWTYDPDVPGQTARKACCDVVNRGVAYWNSRIYLGTTNGYLDVLDAATGGRIQRIDTIIDRTRAYTITGAPRLAGDNIIIGNGGAELGVRGYVSAYNLETGALAWRFFTVPDAGPERRESPDMSRARDTWSANTRWEFGAGGTVWDSLVYDAELGTLYVGVGNGSPWPAWERSPGGGDNLYLSSILALNANTGELLWHYQTTPGDSWDYTATQHMILAEIEHQGVARKVLLQAPKNGFFYVLDRITGELISAEPYTRVTWADRVDLESGRPVVNASANYAERPQVVWPSISGGHNWQPMSYSDETGLVYIPVLETPSEFQTAATPFLLDTITVNATVNDNPEVGRDDWMGFNPPEIYFQSRLKAWDPVTNQLVWQSDPLPWWSGGVLTTGGGLAVQGGADGGLTFHDAASGFAIHAIQTGTAIMAAPITYELDGVQYLAVLAGFGGAAKSYPERSAPRRFQNYERVLVFKLGGLDTPLPPPAVVPELQAQHAQATFDPRMAAAGRETFLQHCARCHAFRGEANNYPNLWNLPPNAYDVMEPVVLYGALAFAGMPSFSDILDAQDVAALREFLLADEARARAAASR